MMREVRYQLPNAPVVRVMPEDDELSDACEVHHARLLDLSRHGAKISGSTEIPTGNSIRLRLTIEELGLEFYVTGAVCWCKPSDDASWLLGCSLQPGFPHGLLDRLADRGHVDRRFDARFQEEVSLSAFWELGGARVPVTLRNYSQGGFCVHSSRPSVPGKRLHLKINQSQVIISTVQWELEVGGGYMLGCIFLNPRDFDRLDAIESTPLPEPCGPWSTARGDS